MRATPRAPLYTLILVGDQSRSVRKLHVPAARIRQAAFALVGVALLGIGLMAHYAALLSARVQDRALRDENALLRSQIHAVEQRVAHITATLDRVEQFDTKLRGTVQQLQGIPRGLAIGPVGRADEAPRAVAPEAPARDEALPERLASLDTVAARQESSLRTLHDYFENQHALLATTPSTWPTRGWVTSDFGERIDPYTAERMMHRGLDIATPTGQAIVAPSDATVAFAGTENGYGKVLVLDHGHGLNTRFGHLSAIYVKPGQKVKRGARVAAVGNSGRSTGPHLHYEVRVNGIAENPRKFILE